MAQNVKRYFIFLILGLISFWRGTGTNIAEARTTICVPSGSSSTEINSYCQNHGRIYCEAVGKCTLQENCDLPAS